jgi:hypothetical protein
VVTAPSDAVRRVDVRPGATEITVPTRRVFRFVPGRNRPTLELAVALALLAWATAGRVIGNRFQMMFLRRGETAGTDLAALESNKIRRRRAKLRKALRTPLEGTSPLARSGPEQFIASSGPTEVRSW